MMLAAVPSRGCHYGSHRLRAFLGSESSQFSRHRQAVLRHASIRFVHGEQLPHDTRTEGIRNIGIIAHVDAVCFTLTLNIGVALTPPRAKQQQQSGCCITAGLSDISGVRPHILTMLTRSSELTPTA